MSDAIPKLPERPQGRFITAERTYHFLTPVFGGGVEPQQHDPITPIRGSAIRGQLRFWWRAVNPRSLKSVDKLRLAEAQVFGDTQRRSPLSVWVSKQPPRPKKLDFLEGLHGARKGYEAIAYGAFPLRKEKDSDDPHGVLWNYGDREFRVCFRFPAELKEQIEAALWGWETFGGLGARTRRGFGAIACVDADGSLALPGSPAAGLERWPRQDVPWPHLRRFRLGDETFKTGERALSALLKELKALRQGAKLGRRPGSGKTPGRSYWPEPDALRRTLNRSAPKHRTPVTHVDAFPRAVFGLPIVFHFKDRMDPGETLEAWVDGAKADRWASPLVLRPYRSPKGAIHALAAELAPRPTAACVGRHQVKVALEPQEAQSMTKPPSAPDNTMFLDPIDAFFQRLQ